jgi:hypothetical protein
VEAGGSTLAGAGTSLAQGRNVDIPS